MFNLFHLPAFKTGWPMCYKLINLYRAPKFTQAKKYWLALETGAPVSLVPIMCIQCHKTESVVSKLHPTFGLPIVNTMTWTF